MPRNALSTSFLATGLWCASGLPGLAQSAAPTASSSVIHIQAVGPILMRPDANAAASQLVATRVTLVSSGVVANHMQMPGFSKAFLARDPDGHAIESAAQ